MSIGDRIAEAAKTAQFWVGVLGGGAVAVAAASVGTYVAIDGRYAKAAELKEQQTITHSLELTVTKHDALLPQINDNVRYLLEGFKQKEFREHQISIPDPLPPDMGPPGLAPRGR